jgi:meso-butanediol dehydrogenase/(S,S)-butanediol dehydrogenase/diacetyl reductase
MKYFFKGAYMILKDKVFVVTGSTRGIGKGIALKIAEEGGIPVVSGSNKDLLEKTLPKEFAELGYKECLFVHCDVTNEKDVHNLMKMAHDKYGKIDGMVANAGITDMCAFEEMTPERWDKMINVNLRGVYLADWAVFPYLKNNGGGKIINIGSDCSLEGWSFLSSYSAAKFGVRGLTQALAKELGKYRINVNCVCPGIIDTDMWVKTDEMLGKISGKKKGEEWNSAVGRIPLGRGGLPDDLGNGVVMLLSKYADYITGCSLPVGGGSMVH